MVRIVVLVAGCRAKLVPVRDAHPFKLRTVTPIVAAIWGSDALPRMASIVANIAGV